MGRILYGVMGDSGGHLSRSLAITQQLKGYEVVFVGGGRVTELASLGYSVVSTPLLGTALHNQRVDTIRTIMNGADVLRKQSSVIRQLVSVIRDFDPNLIVTDYEYFLPRAAQRFGRPCISIDRQHALSLCRYRRPAGHHLSRALALLPLSTLFNAASHHLICSFTPMQVIDPSTTEVMPPVLRADVLAVEPGEGGHAVVYMRGAHIDWVRALLGGRRRRYIVYGFNVDRDEGNLRFRRYSVEHFLADLATCAYAMSNGGHNMISEALYYKKPLLCFPVQLLYEQLLNAHLLAEAGYGAWHEGDRGAASAVDAFERDLPRFQAQAAARPAWDHRAIASRVQTLIRDGLEPAMQGFSAS